ncbi:MAG TPA: PIN domain-containing protein [Pyrinomonadaceae bacterium]|jgi:predicted nucleic acid-binding protein|nr:PIN domain-containing protein [Pyrinomonadaceae bacterium]
MNAVDTNVLIYARDPRDPARQAAADALLSSLVDGVLLWQVACEYVAASRKLEKFGYDSKQAMADVADMRAAWTTVLPSWNVFDRAERLLQKYTLSFWDAMIVAACLEGGVARLYSEDFDASAQREGLEIVNPFAVT